MNIKLYRNKKGQIKVQEMAFVLVAIMIFFALVGLIFVKFRISGIQESAEQTREEAAANLALVLASTPELGWSDCVNCIDFDKAINLKNKSKTYANLWKLDYLEIRKIYPVENEGECSLANYPNCNSLKIVDNKGNFGITNRAYVSLCRYDFSKEREVCEIGEIYVSGGRLNE